MDDDERRRELEALARWIEGKPPKVYPYVGKYTDMLAAEKSRKQREAEWQQSLEQMRERWRDNPDR